jgi:glycosyltransferase involved in cell wall biosynthesis
LSVAETQLSKNAAPDEQDCLMKIGIDASCWLNKRGPGRYTRELVRALLDLDQENHYRLFIDAKTARQCDDLPESKRASRFVIETSEAAVYAASASGHRALHDLWTMGQAVRQLGHDLDLFYFPSIYSFFPLWNRSKIVVTIHDMIPKHHPKLMFPHWHNEFLWKLKVHLAVWQSDLIVTGSETARRDILSAFRIGKESVKVVPNAVSNAFHPLRDRSQISQVLAKYGLGSSDRFILYVGGLSPHKNLSTVIDAYASLIERNNVQDVKLVFVGDFIKDSFYSNYPSLLSTVEKLGFSKKVIFTGWISDTELLHFYNAARLLILSSFDEGFGLPVIEAMACGTPIVASRAGALPEVIGDAGRFFNPAAPEELTARFYELLENEPLRLEMRRRGLCRAQGFSWEHAARSALTLFERLVTVSPNLDEFCEQKSY